MLVAKCDTCKDTTESISSNYTVPKGWVDIVISGQVTVKGYVNRQSVRKLICPKCVLSIFDLTEEGIKTKSVVKQFEDAAVEYMGELAVTAVEEAMEGGP